MKCNPTLTAIALTFVATIALPSCVSVEEERPAPAADVSIHRRTTTVHNPGIGTSETTTTTTRGY